MKSKTPCLPVFLSCCVLFSFAQTNNLKGFVIKGHISGITDGTKVYLYDIDAQATLDSAISLQGNFILKGHVEKPATCWIKCLDETATIQVENTQMEFESPFKNMQLYNNAKGGREQDLQNQLAGLQRPYDKITRNAYDSLVKEQFVDQEHKKRLIQTFNNYQDTSQRIYIEFGKRHPDSFLGLDIIYRNRKSIGKDTVEALLNQLNSRLRLTDKAKALKIFLEGVAEKGKQFIDFNARTIDGSAFRLSSLKGNYILLSFWSAGCGPCRMENRKISKEYNRFKNKISIVSFSTDINKSVWLGASKSDNILWTNVSDLKGDNGKIKTQYDVQAIPASFLINKEGIIVETFMGFDDDF